MPVARIEIEQTADRWSGSVEAGGRGLAATPDDSLRCRECRGGDHARAAGLSRDPRRGGAGCRCRGGSRAAAGAGRRACLFSGVRAMRLSTFFGPLGALLRRAAGLRVAALGVGLAALAVGWVCGGVADDQRDGRDRRCDQSDQAGGRRRRGQSPSQLRHRLLGRLGHGGEQRRRRRRGLDRARLERRLRLRVERRDLGPPARAARPRNVGQRHQDRRRVVGARPDDDGGVAAGGDREQPIDPLRKHRADQRRDVLTGTVRRGPDRSASRWRPTAPRSPDRRRCRPART